MNNFSTISIQSWLTSRLLHFKAVDTARLCLKQIQQMNNAHQVASRVPIQLLIDVSVLIQHDAGTGIQRVVRTVWEKLIECSKDNKNYVIAPIYATRKKSYRYVNVETNEKTNDMVKVNPGDVFLGLDWSAHLLTANEATLCHWKKMGVNLNFVLYDFLPLSNPEWFTPQTVKKFRNWLKTISIYADGILCISNTVKSDIAQWFAVHCKHENIPKLNVFPLGGDFFETNKVDAAASNYRSHQILDQLNGRNFVLTVGTLEPRKGHAETLMAFDVLWQKKVDITLVLVGQKGWGTEVTQEKIKLHPELGRHLFWLHDAHDSLLHYLYEKCTGVIVASKGEGYGLPVIEALSHKKYVLVRDIPVFREITQKSENQVTFFNSSEADSYSSSIRNWYDKACLKNECFPDYQTSTWRDSAEQLLKLMSIRT